MVIDSYLGEVFFVFRVGFKGDGSGRLIKYFRSVDKYSISVVLGEIVVLGNYRFIKIYVLEIL